MHDGRARARKSARNRRVQGYIASSEVVLEFELEFVEEPGMIRIASIVLSSVVVLAACGGSAPAPVAPVAPDPAPAATDAAVKAAAPTSEPAPEAATAKAGPDRAKDAPKWLKDLQDEKEIDDAQRGRLAINGLSEEEFGLPPQLRKAMAAITGNSVDPSQSATIIAVTLSEAPMSDVLAKRCGKPAKDVLNTVVKAKPAERTKLAVKLCKLDSMFPGAELGKLQVTAVLLSGVVQTLLEADPKHGEAEIGLARLAANFNRSDAK